MFVFVHILPIFSVLLTLASNQQLLVWPTMYSSYKIYKSERKIKCHWTSLACRIGLISYMILCKLLLKLARSGCAKRSWRRAYVLRVFLINAFYCTERFLSEQLSQQFRPIFTKFAGLVEPWLILAVAKARDYVFTGDLKLVFDHSRDVAVATNFC